MGKRRGNGEGTITVHKASGRYMAQYTKPNGKRGTLYANTRKEVKDKLNKVLVEIQTHTYTESNSITLIEIITSIIEDKHNSNRIKDNSYRTCLDTINRIKQDCIANMPIQKITTEHLKEYFFRMVNEYNYSDTLIHKNYGLINASFRKAVAKGIVRYNLLDNKEELAKPKSKKQNKKVSALTMEEQKKLIQALDKHDNFIYKNIILLALYTGMRSGEILALRIDDVDFDNKIIHIQRSLSRDTKGKPIIGESTKTKTSLRDITMIPIVENILKNSMKSFIITPQRLLFTTSSGKLISNGMINSAFKRICKKNKINKGFDVNFHMLRHTYATRCIESGMQVKVLAKKLGHKNIAITLNTYTDVFAKMEDKFDNQLIDYLKMNEIEL